jgi:DNA integrity scanning protein DisA with diadenylate cyclase activity
MAEDVLKVLEIAEEVTPEQILYQLLKEKKTPFHTEISNPIAISTLDILVDYFKEFPSVKRLIKAYLKKYRINMVAYKRKRATEIIDAYSSQKELERKQQQLKDSLLGDQR